MVSPDNNAPLLLDVTRLIWRRWEGVRPTGIDRFCDVWLDHFGPRAQAVIIMKQRQAILPMGGSQALFKALAAHGEGAGSTAAFRRKLARLALRYGAGLLRRRDGKGRFWLNPGHTGLHVPALAQWCKAANVRPVYMVHDLIPITHPQFCRPGENAKHAQRMRTALETGAAIIANSRDTQDRLADFAQDQGLSLPPTKIAWPGCGPLHTSDSPAKTSAPPSFVMLGTIEGRKNHALMLAVWQRMLADLKDACPQLVIIGRRGWQAQDVFKTLDTYDFRGKVIEAGALDDAALGEVLSNAQALLFPSFAEGFGMPLIEALAAGIPVIASDLAVFREIAPDIPEFLAPDDADGWQAMLTEYASPASVRRAAQQKRLANYTPPAWNEHLARIEDFLDALPANSA